MKAKPEAKRGASVSLKRASLDVPANVATYRFDLRYPRGDSEAKVTVSVSVPGVAHITETEKRRAGVLLREIIDSWAEAVTIYGERP